MGQLNHSGSYPCPPKPGPALPRIAPVGLHSPMRPSWNCSGCSAPWPCPTKRRQLLAEFHGAPTSLGLLMAVRMSDAAVDLHDVPAGEIHRRFLGWIRGGRAATDPGS
jgi:hypothetical protein